MTRAQPCRATSRAGGGPRPAESHLLGAAHKAARGEQAGGSREQFLQTKPNDTKIRAEPAKESAWWRELQCGMGAGFQRGLAVLDASGGWGGGCGGLSLEGFPCPPGAAVNLEVSCEPILTPTLQVETPVGHTNTVPSRGKLAPPTPPLCLVPDSTRVWKTAGPTTWQAAYHFPSLPGPVPAPPVSAVPPSLGMETVTHFNLELSLFCV